MIGSLSLPSVLVIPALTTSDAALLTLAAGLLLLLLESLRPGRVLPGAAGLLLTLLALHQLAQLPISPTALLLLLSAAAFLALSSLPFLRWTAGLIGSCLSAAGLASLAPQSSLLGAAFGLVCAVSAWTCLQIAARARAAKQRPTSTRDALLEWQPGLPE